MYSNIYLVDDMELVNLMHQVLLRRLGLEQHVKSFTNPEEALDDLRFNLPETERVLVFLDINMPEMNGFEFLEFMMLEDFPSNIDTIIVTSSICEDDKALAEQYPQFVKGFVVKPLKIQDLMQVVNTSISA